MNADQFAQMMATLTQAFQAKTTAPAETLSSSLANRIPEFAYDPDNDGTFEQWYKRHGMILEEDGKELENSARCRLLVSKLRTAEFNRFADSVQPETPYSFTYENTVNKLKALFAPVCSKFLRRYESFRTTQAMHQDVSTFATHVCSL